MMSPFRFPYQGFPYNYYRPNPYLRKTKANSLNNNNPSNSKKTKDSCNSSTISSKTVSSSNNDDELFFEIFGLKLFFDDVLLICLIFFLYSEGVKDEQLFISLILLLIS